MYVRSLWRKEVWKEDSDRLKREQGGRGGKKAGEDGKEPDHTDNSAIFAIFRISVIILRQQEKIDYNGAVLGKKDCRCVKIRFTF